MALLGSRSCQEVSHGSVPDDNASISIVSYLSGVAGFVPTVGTTAAGGGGNAVVYFPYPSPPVSPTSYYAAAAHMQQGPGVVLMRGLPFNTTVSDVLSMLQGFPDVSRLILIRGGIDAWDDVGGAFVDYQWFQSLNFDGSESGSTSEGISLSSAVTPASPFQLTADSVHLHRTAAGQPTGEAFITFPTRIDAERAIVEKRAALAGRQIELYLCGI